MSRKTDKQRHTKNFNEATICPICGEKADHSDGEGTSHAMLWLTHWVVKSYCKKCEASWKTTWWEHQVN